MIQDIYPHRFDRSFSARPAADADIALCYRKGAVLLRQSGESYALPRLGTEAPCAGTQHAFALDGTDCYLADGPEEAPPACAYVGFGELRTVQPMEVAFAAITGAQLYRWYAARRYCGRCGSAMAPGTTERSMVCPRCGLTEYPKICPAVIVAVTNGEKLLLTHYADRPNRGWALIAGFVEIGETLEDTVHREVLEEVGVRVKNLRYYKNQPWSFSDTLLTGFYCELDGDDAIRLQEDELKEGVWMARSDIPDRSGEISLTAEMIERFRRGEV